MARNTLKLDTSGFADVLSDLEKMGGDAHKEVDKVLGEAARKIHDDTMAAIAKPNLPRQGKYSSGETANSVVNDTTVQWDGDVGWVYAGFDFSKPGAGGYLIKGRSTPTKMARVQRLYEIYEGKKYMNDLQKKMYDDFFDAYVEAWAGG